MATLAAIAAATTAGSRHHGRTRTRTTVASDATVGRYRGTRRPGQYICQHNDQTATASARCTIRTPSAEGVTARAFVCTAPTRTELTTVSEHQTLRIRVITRGKAGCTGAAATTTGSGSKPAAVGATIAANRGARSAATAERLPHSAAAATARWSSRDAQLTATGPASSTAVTGTAYTTGARKFCTA